MYTHIFEHKSEIRVHVKRKLLALRRLIWPSLEDDLGFMTFVYPDISTLERK